MTRMRKFFYFSKNQGIIVKNVWVQQLFIKRHKISNIFVYFNIISGQERISGRVACEFFFNAPVKSNSLPQFETWTWNYFQRCQLGRNHALKGGQSFYEASRWKILFFCGAAIRWSRISLSVQTLSVFFFCGIVLCLDGEREREKMHNADLVVVVFGCCSSRRTRNIVASAKSASFYCAFVSSLRHVTIEQMRCGYVLV